MIHNYSMSKSKRIILQELVNNALKIYEIGLKNCSLDKLTDLYEMQADFKLLKKQERIQNAK